MQSNNEEKSLSLWLKDEIKSFTDNSPDNSLKNENNDKAWDEPIVGFSRGDEPLFEVLKEYIDSFYWTPIEIFIRSFPQTDVTPDMLTVISWALPQKELTKVEQRRQTDYPCEKWVRARAFGEKFNDILRQYVVDILTESGFEAVAPVLSPLWETRKSSKYGLVSNWSERHTAYVSGLGTFGLCDGLITPVGKAMRCGSVVANIQLEPTKRKYTNHHEYCLFYSNGNCKECVKRCPANAITENGHDKEKCKHYIENAVTEYVRKELGLIVNNDGCGLCQTSVPCESQIPESCL